MNGRAKSLGISLLISLGITGYLTMHRAKSTVRDTSAIEAAAGLVELSDPTSPTPLTHCYPVAGPDDLDVKTRMDFEGRTSSGWIMDTDAADPGEFCVTETQQAVDKRLARLTTQ